MEMLAQAGALPKPPAPPAPPAAKGQAKGGGGAAPKK
jgi:hypothetical protein